MSIDINGEKTIAEAVGGKLLQTPAASTSFIVRLRQTVSADNSARPVSGMVHARCVKPSTSRRTIASWPRANFVWHLALSDPLPEDNWSGAAGFIHNVLYENYLKNHPAPEDCEYYMWPANDERLGDQDAE